MKRLIYAGPRVNPLHSPLVLPTGAEKATRGLFVAPTLPIFVDQRPPSLAQLPSPATVLNPRHPMQHPLAQPTLSRHSGLEGPRDNDTTYLIPHIPPASGPVGGRLLDFSQRWASITTDSWVLQTLSSGYQLEFTSPLPQPRSFPNRPTPVPKDPSRRSALEKEITSLLEKKAIVLLPHKTGPGFISTFFLAPKKSNQWRPIINLRPLNAFIQPKHFRMETLKIVLQSLPQGWWATSLDLRDAYLHVPIHTNHQGYLQFTYRHKTYQFRCLPFGLSTAPRVFTRITKVVAAALRRQQIHIFMYLDDWLIVGPSYSDTLQSLSRTIQLTQELGFIINAEKSSLVPSQNPVFLGASLNMTAGKASPTMERCLALEECIRLFLTSSTLPARAWLRLLGFMASLVDLVPWCRLHMRPLQLHLLFHYRPRRDIITKPVPVSPLIQSHLEWWFHRQNLLCGTTFPRPTPSVTLTTDASQSGWGAHLDDLSVAGTWSPTEKLLHINLLELLAVQKALQHMTSRVMYRTVLIKTDNSTVVSYINRQGGTHSPSLCMHTWKLLNWCIPRQISLQALHLSGKENVIADALSRGQAVPTEWSLHRPTVQQIFNILDTPHIDLFASHLNHQLPTFCTRHAHPLAWATDSLSLSWSGLLGYAFPPISLLPRVLQKIKQESCKIILVAPLWPRQAWFPQLLDLLIRPPIVLPKRPDLLSQPVTKILHPDPDSLHLCAWMLSNLASEQLAFQRTLLPWQPRADALQPEEHMTIAYNITANGATRKAAVPILHL